MEIIICPKCNKRIEGYKVNQVEHLMKQHMLTHGEEKKPIIAYAYACFDIIHKGHIKHLINAKSKCDKLVCGVLTNNAILQRKPAPTINFDERKFVAEHIKEIDLVMEQDEYSPINNIKKLKPDILIESESHTKEDIANAEKVMAELGGKVIVLPYHKEQSSTNIKETIQKKWKKPK